jgi:hypothetical protein
VYSSCGKPFTVPEVVAVAPAPVTFTHWSTISDRFAMFTVVSAEPCHTESRG